MSSKVTQLRKILAEPNLQIMPCCFDALSAKMIERAGFPLTFMSGFGVSAALLALPDTGLISYTEMVEQGRRICEAVDIPVFGDGDTGYGNALNVKRTVRGYTQAGFAGIMIEDQLAPKRCGHTHGKQVVDRDEALNRIRAAIAAREEGEDIVIMARTDARTTHSMQEALWRAKAFADLGADIVFIEALESEEEMRLCCLELSAPVMVNMVEQGTTPLLPPTELEKIGFKIAAYPLTLLNASLVAMQETLAQLQMGKSQGGLLEFDKLQELVGFHAYYDEEKKYT